MKYLIIIIFFISCIYPGEDYYYIDIPELESLINAKKTIRGKLNKIHSFVTKKIKYKVSLCDDKNPKDTWHDKEGECRDRLGLMIWLTYQYLDIKPDRILLIISYTNKKWHYVAEYKKYDKYMGMGKKNRKNYFKDGKLWIIKEISFWDFIN